jgi:photosystem II stability/assembly factor-like uncharacterized protein
MKIHSFYWLTGILLCGFMVLQGDSNKHQSPGRARTLHISYLEGLGENLKSYPDTGFEAKFTYPYQAALQEYIMTMDPRTRKIPVDRRYESARKAISIKRAKERLEDKLKSGESAIHWNELPANTGGRARALMFDPNDPDHRKVWAGAVTGGLWYNEDITDPSVEWEPVDDFWESLAVGCICADPNDPQKLYVGTGEGQTAFVTYRESTGTGKGIMHSSDGGETWAILPSTTGFAYVTDLQVRDEEGESVIYAGVKSGEYQGNIFHSRPDNGLFRSTDDGKTWSQVLPAVPGEKYSYNVSDIEITSSNRIFVGTTNDLDLEGGGRILYSDNGLNWMVVDRYAREIMADEVLNVPGRVILTSAPSDPDRIYALIGSGILAENGILYVYSEFILRSDDAGSSWIKGPVPYFRGDPYHPANWAYIAWHALTAAVDPVDPDILYIGGCDIFRSMDGGGSWQWISNTEEASLHVPNSCMYVHADQHALVFQPGSSDLLVNANDGGIFMTFQARDSLPCWIERNESFNTMQFYTCAMSPEKDQVHYMGGTQDNSTMLYEGAPVTDDGNRYLGGDGAYCFIDADEPNVHIISTQWNNYAFSGDLKNHLVDYGEMFRSGLFVNPADYSSRGNVLVGNAGMQHGEHADYLIVITNIPYYPAGLFRPVHTGTSLPFSAIRISPHADHQNLVLFLGTQAGQLFKVSDLMLSTLNSREIGSPEFPPANISCIQVGNSEAEILVTFSNYGVPSVWVTQNGGETWLNKEGNLPDIPVRWALWHPSSKKHVLLATEVGTWSCADIWESDVEWTPELEGLANVRVDMLQHRESDQTVLAATHGRGMYTGTWEVPADSLPDPPVKRDFINLYPNPTNGKVTIEYTPDYDQEILVEVFDRTGRMIQETRFMSYGGEFRKILDLSTFSTGTYICRIRMGDRVTFHRVVLVRYE